MVARLQASFARIAALGALGVAAGACVLYALLVWVFSPTPKPGLEGSGGGIDRVSWYALVVAILVPIGLAAAWHVHFARQLRGGPKPIEE